MKHEYQMLCQHRHGQYQAVRCSSSGAVCRASSQGHTLTQLGGGGSHVQAVRAAREAQLEAANSALVCQLEGLRTNGKDRTRQLEASASKWEAEAQVSKQVWIVSHLLRLRVTTNPDDSLV